MGSSFSFFSSPQVNDAVAVGSAGAAVFLTSYAFAPTDTEDFGITGTFYQYFIGYGGTETITPILTVPPLNPTGITSTYTCNILSTVLTDAYFEAPVSGSILCPGAANTNFGAGTATLVFNVDAVVGQPPATFSFSVTTPAPKTVTSHATVRPTAKFVTTTLTACPAGPNSTIPSCTSVATSMGSLTRDSVAELKVKRDNSTSVSTVYGPPDYTLSNGATPPPLSNTVTQTGAPITNGSAPTVTVTVPDQMDFNYSTCSFWTYGVF